MQTYVVELVSQKDTKVTVNAETINEAAQLAVNIVGVGWTVTEVEAADRSELGRVQATCNECGRIVWQSDCPGVDYFHTEVGSYACRKCATYNL